MIKKLDHIGLATADARSGLSLYVDGLGLTAIGDETVPEQGARAFFVQVTQGCNIELLEALGPDTPVGQFLQKRGPGVHHVCYETDDLASDLKRLAERGVRLIDETPRRGAHGKLVAFIHPKAADGVLVELCQTPKPTES